MNGEMLLKMTDMMKRLIEKENQAKAKGIVLPGAPVVLSDPLVEVIKKVDTEIDKMEFYFYAYRPEQMPEKLTMRFDYYGKARIIQEIKNWNELIAKITILQCGKYKLTYAGSRFNPIFGDDRNGKAVEIHYVIREIEEPIEMQKKEVLPIPEDEKQETRTLKKRKGGE